MQSVEPQVFAVAATTLVPGLLDYLKAIGASCVDNQPNWGTDSHDPGEELIEVAGRICYRSWFPWNPDRPDCTNANVTQVREGNSKYIGNILKSGHGAVLEHTNLSIIFMNVSRVFTHELVRHRAGCAYSQESMRYVRMDRIPFWVSNLLREQSDEFKSIFGDTIKYVERAAGQLVKVADLDSSKSFSVKKALTSLIRRIIPMGVATTIIMTANLRSWRHIMNMRASAAAEEEARFVMDKVGHILKDMYPAVFQDMTRNDDGTWSLEFEKV